MRIRHEATVMMCVWECWTCLILFYSTKRYCFSFIIKLNFLWLVMLTQFNTYVPAVCISSQQKEKQEIYCG